MVSNPAISLLHPQYTTVSDSFHTDNNNSTPPSIYTNNEELDRLEHIITDYKEPKGGRRKTKNRKTKKRKSLKRRNKNNKRRTGGRKLRNINPASIPE